MGKKHSDIENEVQKTLESLDTISRATPKPFFFTRLEANLEQGSSKSGRIFDVLIQPKYALSTAALLLLAVLNVTFIVQQMALVEMDPAGDLESVTISEYEELASFTTFYQDEGGIDEE